VRIGYILLTVGLVIWIGSMIGSNPAGNSLDFYLHNNTHLELINLKEGVYTLNIRAEHPVEIKIYSALTGNLILYKPQIRDAILKLTVPVSSIYTLHFRAIEEQSYNVKLWIGPIYTRTRLTFRLFILTLLIGSVVEIAIYLRKQI